MAIVFSNNARTTLASNISNSATTITVADGSVFPSLTGGDIFYCTIDDGTNNEIVEVTAISSNTLTVVRGQDNTTARAFVSGDLIELRLVAKVLETFPQVETGEVTADEFIGDLRGAVIFKAQAGEAVSKGDAVYVSGISGNTPIIALADADFTSKMPAFGLVLTAASTNGSTEVVTFGTISGVDTSAFSVGDTLYVSTTAGELTNSKPTGEASLLQNIGKVQRSHATSGAIKVGGAGRTNDTPNLNDGNIFIGNASNQATTASLNTKIEDYLDANGTTFPDNVKAQFGTGNDLEIYHDGSNSYIKDVGTGTLDVSTNGSAIRLVQGNGNRLITAGYGTAGVKLYYGSDDAEKLATTSTGIDVTGTAVADNLHIDSTSGQLKISRVGSSDNGIYWDRLGTQDAAIQVASNEHLNIDNNFGNPINFRIGADGSEATYLSVSTSGIDVTGDATFDDNGKAIFGAGSDLQIYHDGSHSYIADSGTGSLRVTTDAFRVRNVANNASIITGLDAGGVYLYHNNNLKLETTSNGLSIADGVLTISEITGASAYTQIKKTNTGSNLAIVSQESIYMMLDANDDQTNRSFFITKNSDAPGSGSNLFVINEDGNATISGTIDSGAITSSAKITSNSSIDVIGATGQSGFIYIYDRDNGTSTTDGFLLQKSGNSAFVYNRESSGNLSLGAGNTSNYFVITSTGAIQLGSTQILDQNRDLTNIGTINSGAITSTGASSFGTTTITGNLTVDDKLTIGDATANSNSFIEFGERIAATETNKPFIGQTNSGNGTSQDLGLGANSGTGTVKIYAGNVTKFSESAVRLKVANTYIDFTEPLQMGGTEFLSDTLALSNIASISSGNITTTGYLRGPSTFTIDPATHGDDTGTVVIAGNLQVDGTTTTVNSTTVNVSDKAITLGYDATTDAANNNAGIIVYRPETSNAYILWNETNERFQINRKLNISQDFSIDASGTNDTRLEIGSGTASNHYAYIDLIGDATYTDYGLRIIRNNGGANTSSFIYHRGTGNFNIETQDSAAIRLRTAGADALTLDTSQNTILGGNLSIGGTSTNSSYGVWLQNNKWYATQYSPSHDVVRMNANTSGGLDIYNQTDSGFANVRVGSLNIGSTTRINSVGDIIGTSYYIGSTNIIDTSANLTNIGTISSGAISANSGATNVVATFTSTDATAAIALTDNTGTVELSATGTTFGIQPNGGAAVLTVNSSGNLTTSGTISSGDITITSSGTIGGSTLANAYLTLTDGSVTMGFDANEIHTTDDLYLLAEAGNIIFRDTSNAGVILKNGSTQFMDTSLNLSNIGTISSGAITSTGNVTAPGLVLDGSGEASYDTELKHITRGNGQAQDSSVDVVQDIHLAYHPSSYIDLTGTQTYSSATQVVQTFTASEANGARWYAKVKCYDAQTANQPVVTVNDGTEHQIRYENGVNGQPTDDSNTWTVVDITDDVVNGSNTIKVYLKAGEKTYFVALYVFSSGGLHLPNEPYELPVYSDQGFGVEDQLIITKARNIQNIDEITASTLRLTSTGDAALSSTEHALQVGATNAANVIIDANEVMARSNGSSSALHLNADGGDVTFRNNASGGTTSLIMNGTAFLDQSRNATLGTISSGQLAATTTADATPAIIATNTGGISSVIQRWVGSTGSLELGEISSEDYSLLNKEQNNGLVIYNGGGGVDVYYNGAAVQSWDSTGGSILNSGDFNVSSGAISVSGTGGDNDPLLSLIGSASSTFNWASESIYANLAANEHAIHLIGRARSSKNSGYIGYKYSGTAGSNNNYLTFGHYASDDLMYLDGAGNLTLNSGNITVTGSTSTEDALKTTNGRLSLGPHSSGAGMWLGNAGNNTTAAFLGLTNNTASTLRYWVSGNKWTMDASGNSTQTGSASIGGKLTVTSSGSAEQFELSSPTPGMKFIDSNATSRYFTIGGENGSVTIAADPGGQEANSEFRVTVDNNTRILTDNTGSTSLYNTQNSGGQTTLLRCIHQYGGDQLAAMTADIDFHLWDSNTVPNNPQARIGATGDGTANQNYEAGGKLSFYTAARSHPANTLSKVGQVDHAGDWVFSGNVTAYGSPSDIRLKENIETIQNPLEKVQQLNGVTFNYKKDGNKSTGLIAQDLEKVLPEVVYESYDLETDTNHKAVRYGNIVGLLVEAIKEQQEQIESLKSEINNLKGEA